MRIQDIFHVPKPSSFSLRGLMDYAVDHTDYFIILTFIILSGIAASSLIIRIYIAKKRNARARKIAQITNDGADDILSEYLGEGINLEEATNALNRLLKKEKRPLESIATVFRSYFQMLSGESKAALVQLFTQSKMSEKTLKRLKSPDEHIILYIELTANAKFVDAKQDLKKLLKHPLNAVKFEALCALVDLFKFNALGYMLDVKYRPSEWEEMILMQKLKRAPEPGNLDLKPFLVSDNIQLVRFAVRAAQQFNRFEVSDTFKDLINSPSLSTRKRVYEAAGSLLMNELQNDIINAFENEQLTNQRLILKTLAKLGDEEAFPFLESVYKSKTPELSLLAGKAIYTISNKSEVLDQISGQEPDLLLMLEHIKDPLLA